MAYTPPVFDPRKLEELKSLAATVEGELSSSNTARSAGTDPTVSDLTNEASLKSINRNIEVLNGQKLAEKWYGPRTTEDTFKGAGSQESPLMRGLNALSVPLYATAGAVEGALGKGSKKGIVENITANVKEREGFGNILRRTGLPYAASMPIGFALDVAFDPINWVTAGTSAIIPRLAAGLAKGGAEGFAKGAVSRFAPMGIKTANVMTLGGISRAQKTAAKFAGSGQVPQGVDKISSMVGNISKNIGVKGAEAAGRYDELIGKNIGISKSGVKYGKDLLRGDPGYSFGGEKYSLGEGAQRFIEDQIPGGVNLVRTFKYSLYICHIKT